MNSHLERLQAELLRALHGLDVRQTQLRPVNDPARWSIQQIAGHLRLTYLATVEAMDARIAKATPTRARPSAVQYIAQFTLIRVGYFPRGRRAPERVVATIGEAAMSGTELAGQIAATLSLMDQRMEQAETIFGGRHRVISHMVLGPLSLNQWRKFHLIHGRHHIRQIDAVRKQHGV